MSSAAARHDRHTLFASGGDARGDLATSREWAADISRNPVFCEYGAVEPPVPGQPSRREAERGAAEVRAVALRAGARRAVGLSRGARALLGVLAVDAAVFDRVVLAFPPGGRAAGHYREWLVERPAHAPAPVTDADVLVLALRGDPVHPVSVAEDWASRLGAQLVVFESLRQRPEVFAAMRERGRDFLC